MTIAVKVAHSGASAAQKADAAKLLRNEVKALGRVRHTNVVRLYGACTEPPMLLMQLAPGGTLRKLLDTTPPPHDAARFHVTRGVCSAMAALHTRGILHGDLKPLNVLIADDGTPLVADFGSALVTLTTTMTAGTTAAKGGRGTYQYRAPETWKEGYKYSACADVYSFGMLLWEVCTLETPWHGKALIDITHMWVRYELSGKAPTHPHPSLRDGNDWRTVVPEPLVPMVEQCWSLVPGRRPTFAVVLANLDNVAPAFPEADNAGVLAAAATAKVAELEQTLAVARADQRSLALANEVSQRDQHALLHEHAHLATEIEQLQQDHAAAVADREAHAAALRRARVTFPKTWQRQRDDGDDRGSIAWWSSGRALVTVAAGGDEWRMVEYQLRVSLPTATVTRLERWENRLQFRDYWAKRRNVAIKRRGDSGTSSDDDDAASANEQWLWHGTGDSPPNAILQHEVGLDPRFSSKAFYGRGLYLAEKASYSHGDKDRSYAFHPRHPDRSETQLLLVRAAVGEACEYADSIDKTLTKPPEQSSGTLFDSVRGGPHRPSRSGPGDPPNISAISMMVVLYELAQAYPEYIVTYHTGVVNLDGADVNLDEVSRLLQMDRTEDWTTKAIRLHGSRNAQRLLGEVATREQMRVLLDSSLPPVVILVGGDPDNTKQCARHLRHAWVQASTRTFCTHNVNPRWYVSNHTFAIKMQDLTEVPQDLLPKGCRC